MSGLKPGYSASARRAASTTSAGPRSPPMASTAMLPTVGVSAIVWKAGGRAGKSCWSPSRSSDFDGENLAAAIHAALGVDAMRPDCAAVSGIHGELRRLEGVGRPAVGAAAFGLFSLRVSHDEKCLTAVESAGWQRSISQKRPE